MASETSVAAGRETDARVAASLGWSEVREAGGFLCGSPPGDSYATEVPHYSASPAAALEVVEALRQRGWLVILKAMPDGLPFLAFENTEIRVRYVASGQWMRNLTPADTGLRIHAHPTGMADTLALATARLALECVAAEEEAKR
jgi:hypothetical protein